MLKDDLVFQLNKDLNIEDGFTIPKGTYGLIYMAHPLLSGASAQLYRDMENKDCILIEGFPFNIKEEDMDFDLSVETLERIIERFIEHNGSGASMEFKLEIEARLRVANKK